MGMYATSGDLGSAAGPLLAYAVSPFLDLRWAYLACGFGFVASLALTSYVIRRSATPRGD